MLGLRKQIGGYEGRIGAGIGNDEDFRRASGHVDGHAVFGSGQLLGGGNVAVARSEDFIHGRHAGSAQSQRGHGLRTTGFHHCSNAEQLRHEQNNWAHGAVGLRRRAHHHLRAASQPGRHT